MREEALIAADGVCVRRGGRNVVDNVSLRAQAGDFITIIGPNGAGKSTLLKCLLGLLPPQQGSVKRRPSLRCGYVPQRIAPSQTLPLSLRRFLRLNKNINDGALQEAAALTGIAEQLDTPLAGLSGGQLQRALLARALIGEPALLALDEPAQNLDLGGEIAFYRLLEDICRHRRMTVIMVSHDLHFVMRRSSQVLCMYHHICCSGAPQAVSRNPAFEQLFGADAAQLLAPYPHRRHHAHAHDDAPTETA